MRFCTPTSRLVASRELAIQFGNFVAVPNFVRLSQMRLMTLHIFGMSGTSGNLWDSQMQWVSSNFSHKTLVSLGEV